MAAAVIFIALVIGGAVALADGAAAEEAAPGGIEAVLAVVVIAVIVQAVIEGFKGALKGWDWAALGLGAALCVLAHADLFGLLGVPLVVPLSGFEWLGWVIGAVLTGVIAGRGASAVYDVWRRIKGEK